MDLQTVLLTVSCVFSVTSLLFGVRALAAVVHGRLRSASRSALASVTTVLLLALASALAGASAATAGALVVA